MRSAKYLLIGWLLFLFSYQGYTQNAKKIVEKANELLRSKSSFSEIKMSIIKPDWSRDFAMKIWALEPDYALALITKPAKDKGTVTLKREKEVWNWIPAVQKPIKIPPSMMLQPWMGSDYTNDDLVRQSSIVEDYEHEIIGEEKIDKLDCYKIKLIPKPEAGVVWGKIITWISKEGDLQLKSDYYDEDDYLVKTMIGKNVKTLGGRTIPTYWEMIPVNKSNQKTIFEYVAIRFYEKVNKRFFSIQNMKRVR